MAASCRTGRKDRTQLTDATLSRRPVAKTGAAFPSVRKSFQGARHTSARKQHLHGCREQGQRRRSAHQFSLSSKNSKANRIETGEKSRRNPERFVRWKSKKNSEENS